MSVLAWRVREPTDRLAGPGGRSDSDKVPAWLDGRGINIVPNEKLGLLLTLGRTVLRFGDGRDAMAAKTRRKKARQGRAQSSSGDKNKLKKKKTRVSVEGRRWGAVISVGSDQFNSCGQRIATGVAGETICRLGRLIAAARL